MTLLNKLTKPTGLLNPRGFMPVADEHKRFKDTPYKAPIVADKGSAGCDIHSPETFVIHPNEQVLIWTDVKAYMKLNEVLLANTRSGNGVKYNVVLANTQGWIDSTYFENEDNDGNIGICLRNNGEKTFTINKGDRIAQLMFIKFKRPRNIKFKHEKRVGGFGSSGK